jgi:5-amino-6-(5-phosphoribosylamino)uracil reductase
MDTVMSSRPYVLLSVAVSLDGYVDDTSGERLVLSSPEDLDRVDEVRSGVDAILVGANTIRTDDPRLVIRSPDRRRRRTAAGRPPSPIRVTLTRTGELDPTAAFFAPGAAEAIVYATSETVPGLARTLAGVASVVDGGSPIELSTVLTDLAERQVERLLVEGGGRIHTWFLTAGLVDELHLVVAPFFVGSPDAPRFVDGGGIPYDAAHRMTLVEARPVGDCALLRYLPRNHGRD